MNNQDVLKLYVIKSADGKYLRSKGYGGYGECWVDNLNMAKVWQKPGPAKAQITWWTKNYPTYGVPDLIELHATIAVVHNGTEAAIKSLQKDIKQAEKTLVYYKKCKNEIEIHAERLKQAVGSTSVEYKNALQNLSSTISSIIHSENKLKTLLGKKEELSKK